VQAPLLEGETVSATVVVAVVVPEVPVMVTVDEPTVAVLLAVNVSTLELVDVAGLNEAVTPLGNPVAVKVTLPVNPPVSVTVIVSVPLLPCLTLRDVGEEESVKPAVILALIVSAMVVVAVVFPEVPVTVTVAAPVVAVELAVNVSTLEVVEDVGLNEAVTPLGRPDAVNVTLPMNPPVSVTVMELVPLLPWVIDKLDGEAASVNPAVCLALTVSAMVVVAVVLPEVPVTVTVTGPVVAVELAVSVRTLELAEEVGLNEAVTPLGRPDAVNVTLPVNPSTSPTVMVSVALLPCVTDRLEADGVSVKPGVDDPPLNGNWMLSSSCCFRELGGVAS